ncbi:MAG: hypothetical protein PWP76_170 [Candidatus Diapherotrites archaeon]|nr:hypothetical protein [Candidatus Diapherotrites archaeon]MDN5366596.1 hypothetical protein [Candidatus Diapherotrites archaeon]
MHVPRIVKILLLLVVVYAAWRLAPQIRITGYSVLSSEEKPVPIRPVAPLEVFAHGIVTSAYPDASLVMRHSTGGRYFLYYSPVPGGPDALVSEIQSRGGKVVRLVNGSNWYLSADFDVNGNSVLLDAYPDREGNRLVVLVR